MRAPSFPVRYRWRFSYVLNLFCRCSVLFPEDEAEWGVWAKDVDRFYGKKQVRAAVKRNKNGLHEIWHSLSRLVVVARCFSA